METGCFMCNHTGRCPYCNGETVLPDGSHCVNCDGGECAFCADGEEEDEEDHASD